MKVLVVGSGGREHALIWKIARSKRVDKIFAAPGNAGINNLASPVNINAEDLDSLCNFAKREDIGLTVIGPESPLVKGIVGIFAKAHLRIFGPDKAAAQLEGSKAFAKEMMREFGVPTADFEVFDNREKALSFIKKRDAPTVVKTDGLAAGKGVFVCRTKAEAAAAVNKIMQEKIFGASGRRLIIEDCLEGEEASIIVVSDGENIVPMASSQDHKRIFDDDKGANTGGMGAYSPAPVAEGRIFNETLECIIYPVIRGMKKRGTPYKGVLYAGIMITKDGPYVLEFNVRFGDPETQAILPRMKGDIVELMEGSIDGDVKSVKSQWDNRACVSIVASAAGYPGGYVKGKTIKGLDEAGAVKDVFIFHAGTKREGNSYVTNGGRVLGVSALGDDIENAVKKAYEAIGKIHFEGMHYRKDIGRRALKIVKSEARPVR